MARIEIQSLCSCGRKKPSTERWCEVCKADKANSKRWAQNKMRLLQQFGHDPYKTPNYRRVRKAVIERDKGLCQVCLRNSKITQFNAVDHIVPLSQGGSIDDPANLQCICNKCHAEKTAVESHGGTYEEGH